MPDFYDDDEYIICDCGALMACVELGDYECMDCGNFLLLITDGDDDYYLCRY